jgi:hypothetical protein
MIGDLLHCNCTPPIGVQYCSTRSRTQSRDQERLSVLVLSNPYLRCYFADILLTWPRSSRSRPRLRIDGPKARWASCWSESGLALAGPGSSDCAIH